MLPLYALRRYTNYVHGRGTFRGSKAELAKRVGRPMAWRAAGAANGRNPLPIVVPCHRVILSNGRPGGYYGGTYLKEYLLRLEARHRCPAAGTPAAFVPPRFSNGNGGPTILG